MSQLQRLFGIDRSIRSGRYPCPEELAQEFGVTKRQIYLDRLRLIRDFGAPLYFDRQKRGWGYRDHTWVLPTSVLTEGELLSFFLSVEIARSQSNGAIAESLQSAVNKIAGSLGDLVSVDLGALRDATNVCAPPSARIDQSVYLQLAGAKAARRKLKIRYFTARSGTRGERIVHPYHLLLARGECFLLAFDEKSREVRSFNIARIETITPQNEHFQIAPTFDIEAFKRSMLWAEAGQTLFDIAVQFDPYQARYIRERQWHEEQRLEENEDGSLILRFPASGLDEVARWVLGYGAHAKVLEPLELREKIVSHLTRMQTMYEE